MEAAIKHLRWWLPIALVLALVFAAYLRPDFMLDIGTRISLCF